MVATHRYGHHTAPVEVIAVYGTLRRGGRNHHLIAHTRSLGLASVPGRLHEVRQGLRPYPYPLLLPETDAGERVIVELYVIDDADVMARLDALEDYDAMDEPGSEFVRVTATAWGPASDEERSPGRRVQVYVFNGSAEAVGARVPDGDWRPTEREERCLS